MKVVAALVAFFLSNTANAGLLGPKDYDECILESMKGVTSDVAAKHIQIACRTKFPQKGDGPAESLPLTIVQKIDAHGGFGSCSKVLCFSGTIYNGSSEWKITNIKIRIQDKKTNTFKEYSAYVGLSPWGCGYCIFGLDPLSKGFFGFEAYEMPQDYTWTIVGGKGYRN